MQLYVKKRQMWFSLAAIDSVKQVARLIPTCADRCRWSSAAARDVGFVPSRAGGFVHRYIRGVTSRVINWELLYFILHAYFCAFPPH